VVVRREPLARTQHALRGRHVQGLPRARDPAAVEAAGYVGATTEIPGYASRAAPYELARFEILGSSGVSGVAEDLASG